jgi:glycerol-3-phosphate cytidylyltransferase
MTKIGIIAGCFDIIHPGYVIMFEEAKKYCDLLIIALHSDPTIERTNKLKPILSIKDRKLILESIKYIDQIFVYNTEKELEILLQDLKPQVRFLGDDYKNINYTGEGIIDHVIFLDRSHGWSTTKFKKLVYENYKEWSLINDN